MRIKNFCFFLCGCLLLIAAPVNAKILILIIASDDLPVYLEEQKIWRSYMHSYPDEVEAYFIKANPTQKQEVVIANDVIWSRTEETVMPGILNKTVLSLRAFLPRLEKEFDYVIRTNLSSFYVLPKLIEFVQTLPRKNCYMGPTFASESVYHDLTWVGGHGMILSSDLAASLAKSPKLLNCKMALHDDVVIAWFLKYFHEVIPFSHNSVGIDSLNAWEVLKDNLPSDVFLFRTKNLLDRRYPDEVFVQKALVNIFYPNLFKN